MSLKYEPASVTTRQVNRTAFANPADVVKAASLLLWSLVIQQSMSLKYMLGYR